MKRYNNVSFTNTLQNIFKTTLFELHEKHSNISQVTHNRIINDLNINTEYYLHRTKSDNCLRQYCPLLCDSFITLLSVY